MTHRAVLSAQASAAVGSATLLSVQSVQLQLPTLWKALLQLRLPLLLLPAVQLLSLVTVFWMSTWSSSGELPWIAGTLE